MQVLNLDNFKNSSKVSESVNDNMNEDINLKVPGVAATKFEHTFEYAETEATLIDELAKRNVEFRLWDQPGVKVMLNQTSW